MPDFLETEWLARTADVQVRVNTLRPGDGTAWQLRYLLVQATGPYDFNQVA